MAFLKKLSDSVSQAKHSPLKLSPVKLAVILALVLAIWLLAGDKDRAREESPAPQQRPVNGLHQVEARWSQAEPQANQLVVQGQLLPIQSVGVQAQVTGRVERLLKQQGDLVKAGEPLLQLTDEGRSQQLAQARASVRLQRNELESARALKASQFVPETELIRLESELARAEAELASAELAVSHNQPTAPFDAQVDRRHVDVGEWVQSGTVLMDLVDVTQLKVTAQLPQQEVGRVAVGQEVVLDLLDGRQLQGRVRFISHSADPATRSFYVELVAENPDMLRVAGASATLHIQLPQIMAHRLSPALLSLNSSGDLGVFILDEKNTAIFHPVKVAAIDNDGAVLTGLPERVRVITLGGGFVRHGQQVRVAGASE